MRRFYNPTSFLDLLFLTLIGFVYLFIMSFLMINPVLKKTNIQTKAEYVVTVKWDHESPNDVDTWLEDPTEKVCYFKQKSVGLMHLDRDDTGKANDTVMLPNGKTVTYEYNQEITTIRGIIPGQWTLNVHMYRQNINKPTTVTIEMVGLNPYRVILYKKVTLTKQWQEITVARFTLDERGIVRNMHELSKKLVKVPPPPDGGNRHGGL